MTHDHGLMRDGHFRCLRTGIAFTLEVPIDSVWDDLPMSAVYKPDEVVQGYVDGLFAVANMYVEEMAALRLVYDFCRAKPSSMFDAAIAKPALHDAEWTRQRATSNHADVRCFPAAGWPIPDYCLLTGKQLERFVDPARQPHIRVKEYGVSHTGGSPVSQSLPRRKHRDAAGRPIVRETMLGNHRVFQHGDGGLSDASGRPIVQTRGDSEREGARTGMSRAD